jgi:hypothetical protein
MAYTFGNITFGVIKNVRKSGDEDGVYVVDVEIQAAEGFPFEAHIYCARSDDLAMTGRWVYQQIIDGNIEGQVIQLAAGIDPTTGQPWPVRETPTQPSANGIQTM